MNAFETLELTEVASIDSYDEGAGFWHSASVLAIFDQYDAEEAAANDDCYENLYPFIS